MAANSQRRKRVEDVAAETDQLRKRIEVLEAAVAHLLDPKPPAAKKATPAPPPKSIK